MLLGILAWASLGEPDSYSVGGCRVEGGELTSYHPEGIKGAEAREYLDQSFTKEFDEFEERFGGKKGQ